MAKELSAKDYFINDTLKNDSKENIVKDMSENIKLFLPDKSLKDIENLSKQEAAELQYAFFKLKEMTSDGEDLTTSRMDYAWEQFDTLSCELKEILIATTLGNSGIDTKDFKDSLYDIKEHFEAMKNVPAEQQSKMQNELNTALPNAAKAMKIPLSELSEKSMAVKNLVALNYLYVKYDSNKDMQLGLRTAMQVYDKADFALRLRGNERTAKDRQKAPGQKFSFSL